MTTNADTIEGSDHDETLLTDTERQAGITFWANAYRNRNHREKQMKPDLHYDEQGHPIGMDEMPDED